MALLTPLGLIEVIGTAAGDAFTGRRGAVIFGRQGNDVFTTDRGLSSDEDQTFFGGSGADTYVVRPGTSAIIGDGFGSRGDTLRSGGVRFNSETTGLAEVDGRHLVIVDLASDTGALALDWLHPERAIERYEFADGARALSAADVRSHPNYIGNVRAEDIFGSPAEAFAFREQIRAAFREASQVESTPQPALVQIIGTTGDDQLSGDARAEIITGLDGDDTILGEGGNDRLVGGGGADTMQGGAGADALSGGTGNDTLDGGPGRDTLQGGGGADVLLGRDGADTLTGNAGDDELSGGSGDDVMTGGPGNDEMLGGIGDDLIQGGAGADLLSGGAGDDTLDGNGGADELTGGQGADVFAFSALGGGLDRVTDFRSSSDSIDLSDLLPNFTAGDDLASFVQLTNEPSGTLIAIDPTGFGGSFTEVVLLEGVSVEHLTPEQLGLPTLAQLSPADLDGSNGVTLIGEDRGTVAFEGSVSGGDIDGDGLADIVIGRPADAVDVLGESFVVLGKTLGSTSSVALNSLDGANGFRILAESPQDASGISLGAAGDIDGNGVGDLIIGAPRTTIDGNEWAGRSYVVIGGSHDALVDLADVAQGVGGFAISGIAASDQSGFSVSGAGDVNLDGLADLIVGAPFAGLEGDQSGQSFVVFGKTDHTPVNLNDVAAGDGGFVINGASAEDWSGWPVSRGGDVNGDGADDVLIAAKLADPDGRDAAGTSYVVFGKAGGTSIDLNDIEDGIGGFAIHGVEADDNAGASISGGGDINGDGLADLIVGAGEVYAIFGKADGAPVELSEVVDGNGGFVIDGRNSGSAVGSAGDINGDSLDDLIIGAVFADGDAPVEVDSGEAYIVYGKADGAPVDLNDISADVGGFMLVGEHGFDHLGASVTGAGDVDGDGFADILVDAPGAGETYVVFGGDFTGAVDRLGTVNNDRLTGITADEVLIGGQGDDVLIGRGGLDVLNGGAGNDVLALTDPSVMEGIGTGGGRLLGGSGVDTIRLNGSGKVLDLAAIPDARISGIETVDLGGRGNELGLNIHEVLNLSDTSNTVTVLGDASDVARGELPGASVDTTSNPGFITFAVGQAQLLVQTGIDTAGIDTTTA